jgi:hypothetical protein
MECCDTTARKKHPRNSDETLTNDVRDGACLVTTDEEAEEAHHHYSTVGHLKNREQTRPAGTTAAKEREKVNTGSTIEQKATNPGSAWQKGI